MNTIRSVTLVVTPNVAKVGDQVTFTATLPGDDGALHGRSFRFHVGSANVPTGQNRSHVHQLESGWGPGKHEARVHVDDEDGKEVFGSGSATFYVLKNTDLAVSIAMTKAVKAGEPIELNAALDEEDQTLSNAGLRFDWQIDNASLATPGGLNRTAIWQTSNADIGTHEVSLRLVDATTKAPLTTSGKKSMIASETVVITPGPLASGDTLRVALQRSTDTPTPDLGLWAAIRSHAKAISFGGLGGGPAKGRGYQGFIDLVLCEDEAKVHPLKIDQSDRRLRDVDLSDIGKRAKKLYLPRSGMAAYELLKTATEIFLLWNCGVAVYKTDPFGNPLLTDDDEMSRSGLKVADIIARLSDYLGSGRLPYIQRVVQTAFPEYVTGRSVFCTGALTPQVDCPCLIELIWSYWHEEGMLVQSMNTISRRFQNVRGPADRDPLAHLEIDPLRPLNNFLWSYIQDEQNLLTVRRRAYEYDHHYGLTTYGKAVPTLRPADSRSKFLEGFHNLLHLTSIFYKEDNDTTVIADGFPLLNALREVHLLLAQGAHNQFGDLPWNARAEMMVQQWLLARPEMRDFLQSRAMVPYTEAWMPQVDTMKTLQGWSDVTVTHFRDLGVYGEQILLGIRYGDWIDLNDENYAKNWARYWRPEIQAYLHAYRAVTGVDLTNPDTVDPTMPAVHLQKRLAAQRAR